MPCCTLIGFLLGQLGVAGGLARLRLFELKSAPAFASHFVLRPSARWRWAGLGTALTVEILLAGLAAPYLFTSHGRSEAMSSFAGAWHLCAVHVSSAAVR